jgi:SAM-dependent methyltransferase
MAITFSQAKFLLYAMQKGTSFQSLCTIGRMTSYFRPEEVKQLRAISGCSSTEEFDFGRAWCDGFFRDFLKAELIRSIDYSHYEGAELVHDMNQSLPPQHNETFDVVIDSGSLEHVFNFPVAIANCMNLVRTGGSLFLFTPANNHCGHGFYQFSPELMFRIFQPENGFELVQVILEPHAFPGIELSGPGTQYRVADPATVGTRVGLVTSCPVMMMIHARKTQHVVPFQTPPLQSDYATKWSATVTTPVSLPQQTSALKTLLRMTGLLNALRTFRNAAWNCVPQRWKQALAGRRQLQDYSFRNQRHYMRID